MRLRAIGVAGLFGCVILCCVRQPTRQHGPVVLELEDQESYLRLSVEACVRNRSRSHDFDNLRVTIEAREEGQDVLRASGTRVTASIRAMLDDLVRGQRTSASSITNRGNMYFDRLSSEPDALDLTLHVGGDLIADVALRFQRLGKEAADRVRIAFEALDHLCEQTVVIR